MDLKFISNKLQKMYRVCNEPVLEHVLIRNDTLVRNNSTLLQKGYKRNKGAINVQFGPPAILLLKIEMSHFLYLTNNEQFFSCDVLRSRSGVDTQFKTLHKMIQLEFWMLALKIFKLSTESSQNESIFNYNYFLFALYEYVE